MRSAVELLHAREGTIAARIVIGAEEREIRYATDPAGALARGADPFVAPALLPAMKLGQPLEVAGSLSPRLIEALPRIQEIFHGWSKDQRPIEIRAQARALIAASADRGVACFFSGGVDSFFTLLKRKDEISHLVLVHGFDVRLSDTKLRERTSREAREVAQAYGMTLVEVETTARSLEPMLRPWWFSHGTVLAGVLLALAPRFRRIFIPASHSYAGLFPWGSHPILDPLWSTEEIEVVHDGCEASRFEKVERLACEDFVLARLRVCHLSIEGRYNCGRCRKCVRTQVSLTILGALARCPVFEAPLDLDLVERTWIGDPNVELFTRENLRAAEERGADARLIRALRRAMAEWHHRGWRRHVNALRTRLGLWREQWI